MHRILVNATPTEIARAREGPVQWDVAVHGAMVGAPWRELEVRPLDGRPPLDTQVLRRRLRGWRRAVSGPAESSELAPRPALGPARPPIWFERAARLVLETDTVRVLAGIDAVFTHLRGVRPRPRRVRVIRSTNGVIPEIWNWRPSPYAEAVRDRHVALERTLADRADLVVCWTEYGAANLVAAGVDSRRVVVAPPVFDLPDPAGDPFDRGERPRAVFIGDPFLKGLPEALAALDQVPDLELHIVGPGPPPADDRPARTVWHGRLRPDQVAGLLRTSEFLLVPARYETFGVTYLEAMRAGAVVVASGLGTVKEVVGDAGVLVGQGDVAGLVTALRQLVESPRETAALAEAGRRRYEERFSQPAAARALEDALAPFWR